MNINNKKVIKAMKQYILEVMDESEVKRYKKEFRELVDELRKMKEVLNREVYKGRWRLVKFLIK